MHRQTTIAARLVLSSGDLLLRSVPMLKDRVSIGRRPYNDVALDDMTVSGEHAVIFKLGDTLMVRDLQSRNGTLVNGELITEQPLRPGDTLEIGIYQLRFLVDPLDSLQPAHRPANIESAELEFLNGEQAGRRLSLDRSITSISDGAGQVAVVGRRRNGFFLTHMEGMSSPQVNGAPVGLEACELSPGDLIELGTVMLRFHQSL